MRTQPIVKPQAPVLDTVPRETANALRPIIETLDIITGNKPNYPPLEQFPQLAASATLADTISRLNAITTQLNELIRRVQR
jgi:hypothetical protein